MSATGWLFLRLCKLIILCVSIECSLTLVSRYLLLLPINLPYSFLPGMTTCSLHFTLNCQKRHPSGAQVMIKVKNNLLNCSSNSLI